MSWDADIADFVRDAKRDIAKFIMGVRVTMSGYVIMGSPDGSAPGTPVYTGNARGSWQATLGSPAGSDLTPESFYEDYPYGTHLFLDPEWGRTMSGAQSVAKEGLFGKFYLTSNVRYINALETGTSTQAPFGMVGTAVASFELAVQDVLNGIGE